MNQAKARKFQPLTWQVEPYQSKATVLLLTGSAGGGKSRLAGEMIHRFCADHPNSTGLLIRKTRESMTNSTVLFMRRTIIQGEAVYRQGDHRFEYSNGSILAYGGMKDEDQREQIRSIGQDGSLDIVWIEEANKLLEADYNEVIPRMRGRAAGYSQIILTTNPDSPLHWIYRRLILSGEAKTYYSHAADNPYNPAEYQARLAMLTGTQAERLREGKWTQAEGLVYDGVWDDGGANGSVTEQAEYMPGGGEVVWAIDDGYSAGSAQQTRGKDPQTGEFVGDAHPRVILFVQIKPDGHIDVFDEDYQCLKLSDQHIAEGLARPYPAPTYAVHGPGSAEIRGRLHEASILARQCTAKVEDSIKELRGALAPDANGWRRVRVHPRCRHLRSEMVSYAYETGTEKPIKQFDHGPDATRYIVWSMRHER